MLVLVVGCGSFGKNLALELEHSGHEIVIIDHDYQNFASLPESFHGKRISGDAMVQDVLQRARVLEVEAVVLTSRNDVNNLVMARLFKNNFQKKTIIALNTNPMYRFYYELMDIDTVSMLNWGSLKIEEMLTELPADSVYSVGTTDVGSYNVKLPEGAGIIRGEALNSIPSCIIFALTHAGETSAFMEDSLVHAGDVLHVSASSEGLKNLYRFFDQAGTEGQK